MIAGVVMLYHYFLPNNSYKHEGTCCNYVSICFFIRLEPLHLNYYIDRFVLGCSTEFIHSFISLFIFFIVGVVFNIKSGQIRLEPTIISFLCSFSMKLNFNVM